MGIISWIVFGLIVGIIAKFIMPGKQGGGFILTTILGVVGAFVGGFVGSFFGWSQINSFSFNNIALAVAGALLVLVIYNKVIAKK